MNNKQRFKDFDLAFIDTETTGRGPQHELTEIAVVRASSFNFAILEEWVAKIKPEHLENAEAEALRITNYSEEAWRDALDEESALKIFLKKAEKTILVGQNLTFDWFYIHKALGKYNLQPTFWYKSLDTFTLAWQKLRNDKKIKSLSLNDLVNYFDIARENPHSALDDARTAYKVFMKLLEI